MKKSNLVVIVSTTLMSLFFMTRLTFSCDNIFPCSGNVGIGTTSPDGKFNVQGGTDVSLSGGGFIVNGDLSGLNIGIDDNEIMARNNGATSTLYIQHEGGNTILNGGGGKVGIGTTTPGATLDVAGRIRLGTEHYGMGFISSNASTSYINLGGGTTYYNGGYIQIYGTGYGTTSRQGDVWLVSNTAGSDGGNIRFINFDGSSTWSERMRITDIGYVGIGTTSPDYILDVNGTIRAKEVLVATGWSDFVFDDNYNLPSLAHVESYIEENNHLPDIPSAKEIQENGVSMAEMIGKQMQKIEELTLYVIEQNKQINELKDELAELKKTN